MSTVINAVEQVVNQIKESISQELWDPLFGMTTEHTIEMSEGEWSQSDGERERETREGGEREWRERET